MNPPVFLTPNAFIRFVGLLVIGLFLAFTAAAQGLQPRPVARLLGEAINDATRSRAHTVSSTDLTAPSSSALTPSLDEATEAERAAFDKTNEARAANGLIALAWDSELCQLARKHSAEMAQRGYFDHDTPEGLRLKDRARAVGIQHFRVIAENIAYNKGYSDPGSFAVERWMKSPGHRSNILYEGFQAVGIGSYVAGDGSVFLTQVFIYR